MNAATPRRGHPSLRRTLAVLFAVLSGATLAGLLHPSVADARALPATTTATTSATSDSSWRRTQTLTREHEEKDGSRTTVDQREVTVTADHTADLRGRERVRIAWSGAHPTGGRTSSPYSVAGLNQEYPVVILQCRGLDDPSLPASQRVSPETCWTSTYTQRSYGIQGVQATWRRDLFATEAERADQDHATTWPAACEKLPVSVAVQHVLPFRAADGTVYAGCSESTMPPEAALDAALPAAEQAAFTTPDGTGSAQFEIRTATENESLGCSQSVACSIVVIPIMGISCTDTSSTCRSTGKFEAGSDNSLGTEVANAVSSSNWWSPSNWKGRFSIPLGFASPPDVCDILDDRAPVNVYGSELMNQATLQWAPAYCLREDRFKLRHNRGMEPAARRLLRTGEAVGAFVTEPDLTTSTPLGYAPVAVTGFGIAYAVDRPDNGGQVQQLRLTPRLIAKLLTQSYPASIDGRRHPGLEKNPVSINQDPEFTELNPGLSEQGLEAAATLFSLSQSSDVMTALTRYLASDEEAAAFLAGTPDPWGMTVNSAYKGLALPVAEWPLKDSWVRTSGDDCAKSITQPYLSLVAGPVNSLTKISEAVLDAWPNTQTRCTRASSTDPYKIGRVERQSFGSRFMLGLVSVADAERYGLTLAELRTDGTGTAATFVAPTDEAMAAAVTTATQAAPGAAWSIDPAALPPAAYPGTMVVHLAAPLTGMTASDAQAMALLARTATSEGQIRGAGNGELPAGYLPITPTGATASLYAAAQQVAAELLAQDGRVGDDETPSGTPLPAGPLTGPGLPSTPSTVPVPVQTGSATTTVDGLPADPDGGTTTASATAPTPTSRSRVADAALPATLGVALLGPLAPFLIRRLSTRKPEL